MDNEHLLNWEIAYAARELRKKNFVTLTCSANETNKVLEQLSLFSNSNPLRTKTIAKPDSNEVLLEIINS